jgi:hypothetical protein
MDTTQPRFTKAGDIMVYLLHVRHASGKTLTTTFTSAFARSLALIALAAQPIVIRLEDVAIPS